MSDLTDIRDALREFTRARGWEAFHDPKNLSMALASEAGELLAELRWLRPDEATAQTLSPDAMAAIASEVADITIFLVRLADVLNIDIAEAVATKMRINEGRFPTDR